jgi:hypothetical protein
MIDFITKIVYFYFFLFYAFTQFYLTRFKFWDI